MKKNLALLVIIITALFNITVFADNSNLVKNPDFEKGSLSSWEEGVYDTAENVSQFFIDDTVSHSGSKSACIINNAVNHSRYKQKIKVKGNSYYKLSCWVKTENVGEDTKGAYISVDEITDTSRDIRGTSDWEYVELYGVTEKKQDSITLSIALGGYSSTNTGKAWFDDVVVEKVDKLPSNVNVVNLYPDDTPAETPKLPVSKNIKFMVPYSIIFFVVGILLIFLAKKNILKIKQSRVKIYLFISLGIGLLLRLIAAPIIEGFSVDIGCFTAWSMAAAKINGISTFYTSGMFCDYPPFYILVLALVGHISNFIKAILHLDILIIMIKLPAIIADIVSSYIIYRFASKRLNPTVGLILSVLYAFNPVVFTNSTLWGQADSFFTMILLLALILIDEGKLSLSAAVFTIGVLTKPQGIIFLPVIGYELIIDFIKTKNPKNIGLSALLVAATTAIVIIPFSAGRAPTWLIDLYVNTAEGYKYASMNAYNFFSLLGANLRPDNETFFILDYYTWGMLFIVLTSLFTGFLYFVNYLKHKQDSLSIAPIAALIQITGVFVLSTRMHERYLFAAVALALLVYIFYKDIGYLLLFGGISATAFVNTYTVLNRMLLTDYPHVPPDDKVLLITSFANVLLCLLLFVVTFMTVVKNKIIVFDFNSDSGTSIPEKAKRQQISKGKKRK
jgi:dolichyl-phosphate-mannose-protein mannosyltransferase